MKIEIRDLDNKAVGEVEVPEAVFSYPYKEHLIHEAVVAVRAAQRAGTHKVKGRHEVRGGGKKPWRQKGTGRARVGSRRSPLWRAGGTVHGPTPRDHSKKLSPREKRNALKSVLSRKLSDEQVHVVDSLELPSHKTKEFAQTISGLGISGKALVVDDWNNRNLALAVRNNPAIKAVDALGVNVCDVIERQHLLLSRPALESLVRVLSK